MIEYKDAIKKVFLYIERRENIRVLSSFSKKKYRLPELLDIWEITTEILDKEDKIRDIRLNIIFFPDFPLTFPKILISKEDFEEYKYIPHLGNDRLICIFQNNSQPNFSSPEKVVEEAIRRAKNIIEEGVKGNNDKDYEEEFEAYWNSNYSKNDLNNKSFLILNEKPLKQDFDILKLEVPVNEYQYIIHQNEKIALNFIDFLKEHKFKYTETQGYLISDWDFFKKPPYNKTNKEIFNAIEKLDNKISNKFINLINDKSETKIFLFSKEFGSEIRYFGWYHCRAKLNRKGFRKNSLNNYKVLSTFQSKDKIIRILPHFYNNQRCYKRSAGQVNLYKSKKFVIAGVGSIGSNLIHYLNSMKDSEFKFIDTDTLKLENIGRHFLGFNYLNWKKTKGLRDFLKKYSPIQKVETREKSVVQIIKQEPEFINNSDFLFIAIGESNIELWIANAIENKLVTKPTFFIWVEPYLLGGHCIYINPKNNIYKTFFNEEGIFKFNIIGDYNNQFLSLKEAGCQSNFTPYSSSNIQLFLGHLYLKIHEIIKSNNIDSKSFSWVGDKNLAKELGIMLSNYSLNIESNTLIENLL